jgi:hypothetical protein
MFNTRFWEPMALLLAAVLLLAVLLLCPLLLQLWLNICQGTGISLPVVVEPTALLGVPTLLERLEGVVSLPEVEVSDAAPAVERDRMANSTRPDCGSIVKSRICPRVFPS